MSEHILDEEQFVKNNLRRRDLLPTWIKLFTWVFLIFGAITPIVFVLGIVGINGNISLYGLETNQPLSLMGMAITVLFLIKGVVAFGLWTEKKWAVDSAIADAVIGIIVCIIVMVTLPSPFMRLELIPLILYLRKMVKIKPQWMKELD